MLARMGLQRRIMLYVAVGLAIMFGAFSYIGMQAVRQSTDLVFEERLAIAQGVAAAVGRDFDHVMGDIEEDMAEVTPGADRTMLEAALRTAFFHVSKADTFAFFEVSGARIVDSEGRVLAGASEDSPLADLAVTPPSSALRQAIAAGREPVVFWPEDAEAGQFASVSVPLSGPSGDVWSWVVVDTEGFNSTEPFVPFGLLRLDEGQTPTRADDLPRYAQYHLEVLTPSGTTVLGIGPDEPPGGPSSHYSLVHSLMESGGSDVLLHRVADTGKSADHVMAVVPVPLSDLYLVLEQDQDIALALPTEFQRRLVLFSVLGFLATIVVAWVTTRHVVKPTEVLTAAAVRMAGGDLETPISVPVSDEIGILGDNLETMRRQLQEALADVETANLELESRVRERTLQLQELVQRTLNAQEEERRRVALELHDETAQTIAALTITLDSVVRRNDRLSPEDASRLREAWRMASDLLEEIRRLISALRPFALESMGLAAALRSYAEDHLERTGTAVHAGGQGGEARVPEHVELALYRIGQESINNVARHAGADNVWITTDRRDSVMTLTVRDDGAGFDWGDGAERGP